jgi:N-acetyl-anhydromuramyl-L-alanine amidase AmpD
MPKSIEIRPSTDGMETPAAAGTPAAAAGPAVDRTTLTLAAQQYFGARFRKDLIVLHFTAGQSARSAVETWRANPERVATAYVVDADGTIYETFPPEFWAYHLGIKGGTAQERRSIGIEIANAGPLQLSAANPAVLTWWPKNWTATFCGVADTERYVKQTYRGKHYFAAFAGAQMDATAQLVGHLCTSFGIPKRLAAAGKRLERDQALFSTFSGVATHVNFRDDKWDVGPAFDFDRLGL